MISLLIIILSIAAIIFFILGAKGYIDELKNTSRPKFIIFLIILNFLGILLNIGIIAFHICKLCLMLE